MIRGPWKIRRPSEGWGPSAKRRRSKSHWGPSLRWGDESEAESGFTLVELMVVIVIIGLLATVVIINVLPATDKAALTKAKADVATLEQGVEMYRLNRMRYPNAGEGLQAVVSEGFVKRLPKDPWGNPYRYAAPGRNGRAFDIYSYGADGREGGDGKDADIGNWENEG